MATRNASEKDRKTNYNSFRFEGAQQWGCKVDWLVLGNGSERIACRARRIVKHMVMNRWLMALLIFEKLSTVERDADRHQIKAFNPINLMCCNSLWIDPSTIETLRWRWSDGRISGRASVTSIALGLVFVNNYSFWRNSNDNTFIVRTDHFTRKQNNFPRDIFQCDWTIQTQNDTRQGFFTNLFRNGLALSVRICNFSLHLNVFCGAEWHWCCSTFHYSHSQRQSSSDVLWKW